MDELTPADDVLERLVASAPAWSDRWFAYIESEYPNGVEPLQYVDAGVLARWVLESESDIDKQAASALLAEVERQLSAPTIRGDESNLLVVGFLEGIQNQGSLKQHRSGLAASTIEEMLGPRSRLAWDELNRAWTE